MKRFMAFILLLAVCAGTCACGQAQPADTVKQTEKAQTQPVTEAPTEAPAEPPTEAPTEAVTEPPKPQYYDGQMVYFEDFSSYGDVEGTDGTVSALGWQILTAADLAPSDWDSALSIKDGELIVENYSESTGGTDSYVLMLQPNYMKQVRKYGKYTLQYDVTYTAAGNAKRYINIVTEYSEDGYNSYHFRIGGYGNNQCYCYKQWFTYDIADDDDLFAAQKKNENGYTTIAMKLLGLDGATDTADAINNFKDKTVTIRIRRDLKNGSEVYMKTADMEDFVLVSRSSEFSEGYDYLEDVIGNAVCLKAGGKINGRVDNIAIWLGFTDMPEDKTVTYQP